MAIHIGLDLSLARTDVEKASTVVIFHETLRNLERSSLHRCTVSASNLNGNEPILAAVTQENARDSGSRPIWLTRAGAGAPEAKGGSTADGPSADVADR